MTFAPISPARLFHALLLVALATLLSACATRTRPVEPAVAVTVSSVVVAADLSHDDAFGRDLEARLLNTAGRSNADIGRASHLAVFIRSRGHWRGPAFWLPDGSLYTEVAVTLTDAFSGRIIYATTVRSVVDGRNQVVGDEERLARLVADIRQVLGLSGLEIHPVGGLKRPVVRPARKPVLLVEPTVIPGAVLSDPLLNGEVTPTTVLTDEDPEPAPVLDTSRPLLAPEPATPEPATPEPATPEPATPEPAAGPAAPSDPQSAPATALPVPAAPVPVAPTAPADLAAPGSAEDEPCVVTVDNDCSDPDAN